MGNSVYIACSLDGFIAGSDGSLEWLTTIPNESGSDYGYSDFLNRIDAVVMGRNTYETVLSFEQWPYEKPVFVLSTSLKEVPKHLFGKVELVSGEVRELVESLNSRGYTNLYIDGGRTIQSFLREDCIDEMIITTVSTVLGEGIPLFWAIDKPLSFRLVSVEKLSEFLVKCTYTRHCSASKR